MNLKHVGKVMDAHGIRGELYCLIFSGDVTWLPKIKILNLKNKNEMQSFEVKKLKVFKRGFIASLKDFDNRNKAEEFKGAEVWIDENIFVSEEGEALYLNEIMGFKIEDKNLGTIGTIISFSSNGLQDLLVVEAEASSNEPPSKNILSIEISQFEIPFVKAFVLNMDFKNKKILTDLPEGLLEINVPDED